MNHSYEKLIDPGSYQVFLFFSNAVMPFSFATHPWFVVNNKGDISRWEIIVDRENLKQFVREDFCKPLLGSAVFPLGKKFYFKSKLLGYITGDESSSAKQMVDCILKSREEYLFKDEYGFLGPNSNTYAQWILDMFPEFKGKLQWNSFGKGYKRKGE
jgi:hypothetical protein